MGGIPLNVYRSDPSGEWMDVSSNGHWAESNGGLVHLLDHLTREA